jgi:biopolymer transport protein ExbD
VDFETASPARRPEAILPMINLVFLLLVFFLLVATLAPPAPLAVTPPALRGADPAAPAELRLFLDSAGTFAFGDRRGHAALEAARRAAGPGAAVALHADRSAPAHRVAAVVADLAAAGAGPMRLVVTDR